MAHYVFAVLLANRQLFLTRLCLNVEQILHFLMAFSSVYQQACSIGLFSALLLKIVSYFFLNLLTRECKSKVVFSWITQYEMNISLFWPGSIFG